MRRKPDLSLGTHRSLHGITAAKEGRGLGGALGGGEIGAELGASLGPYVGLTGLDLL